MNPRKLLEAQSYAVTAIRAGQHMRVIRAELRKRELPVVRYEQVRHQGKREVARRARQAGLCEANCGRVRQWPSPLCHVCLAAKWGGSK